LYIWIDGVHNNGASKLSVRGGEEEEQSTERAKRDQPLARAPCATLYSGGQGYNDHLQADDTDYSPNRTSWRWLPPLTLPLIALDGTQHPCTLYFFNCDLTTVMSRTVLGTVMVGKPPLCTLSS
jgi:hypothetical protein